MRKKADRLIPVSSNTKRVLYNNGDTSDIITSIVHVVKKYPVDLCLFAYELHNKNPFITAENDWKFVKANIKYLLDPEGQQFIKRPASTWMHKYSDCKGFSIFLENLLRYQGIKCAFRFVSYSDTPTYTHVYVIALINGRQVTLDCCLNSFNKEKQFTFKKDITMAEISEIGNAGEQNTLLLARHVKLPHGVDYNEMTRGELELFLAKARLEAEKEAVIKLKGENSTKSEKYQDSIDAIQAAIEVVKLPNAVDHMHAIDTMIHHGHFSLAGKIMGVDEIGSKASRKAAKEKRRKLKERLVSQVKGKIHEVKTKTGAFIKKAANYVKDHVKAFKKQLTDLEKKAVQVILEHLLPVSAPFFLYLFITDQKIIKKLPLKARAARKQAENIATFIINTVGIENTHFMQIVRTGVIKHYHKSPETVLAGMISSGKIGDDTSSATTLLDSPMVKKGAEAAGEAAGLPPGASDAIMKIIQKIIQIFKKSPPKEVPDSPEAIKDSAPDPTHFEDTPKAETKALASDIKTQADTPAFESAGNHGPDEIPGQQTTPETGKKVWNSFSKP